MKKNMNENFEITVDEMTEIFGDTPVEMSFREVKEGMDSFFGLMGLTVELVSLAIHLLSQLSPASKMMTSPGFIVIIRGSFLIG